MIVALQDETPVIVYPFHKDGEREEIMLKAGEALIFRGDLIHCGAEFDEKNVRVHTYIDSAQAPTERGPNDTYEVLGGLCEGLTGAAASSSGAAHEQSARARSKWAR